MVVYNCPRCGYSTGNKSYFRKHLLRKKVCKVVLNDIPVEKILQDIEVRKNASNLKLEHFKNNSKKSENVTKNVTKQKNTGITELSGENNVTKNINNGGIVHNTNVTKQQFSVSQQKVTLKAPETSKKKILENNDEGTNLQKIWADAGIEKLPCVSQNVSHQKVTLKPPESSIDNNHRNSSSALNLQKIWADANIDENACVSQNVSHQKVTFKPPQTKSFSQMEKNTSRQKLQKIWADAKNLKNNSVSQQKVTSETPETSYSDEEYNCQAPDHLQKSLADAKMLQKKHRSNVKNRRKSGVSMNKECYENIGYSSNLLYDNHGSHNSDYSDTNEYEIGAIYDDEYPTDDNCSINQAEYHNNNNYYNNFEAPPVMNATPLHHHSPNKLYTTKINKRTKHGKSSYHRMQQYEDHNYDEDEHYCQYCGQLFKHRQSKWKHEKKCSKKNVLANKCSQLEKQNKEKDKAIEILKAQMEIMMEKVGSQVHNHNTTNYSINVYLNAFGSERIDYLTSGKVRQIMQQGGPIESIPSIVKAIHFNPEHTENQNIIIPSRKDNVAKIWNGKQWVLKAKETTINEMTDKAYNLINEHYEDGNKQYEDFTDKYAKNDKLVKKRVTQDTELMIINSTKSSQKTITQR